MCTIPMKAHIATLLILFVALAEASFGQMSLAATDSEAQLSVNSNSDVMESNLSATAAKTGDRFERIDTGGHRIGDGKTWSCVADKQTSLVWEVKTDDGGLRDTANSYSWYDPNLEAQAGVEDGGRCRGGVKCDTHHYKVSLNQQRLCGFDDWRLPSREELETLVEMQAKKSRPSIDLNYFPVAEASWYWTASSNDGNPDYAWYVLFRNGVPLNDLKARPKHVRLVRGGKLPVASNQ